MFRKILILTVLCVFFYITVAEQTRKHYITHSDFFKTMLSKSAKETDRGYIIQAGCKKGYANFNGKCRRLWCVISILNN